MGNITAYAADGLMNAILCDVTYTLPSHVYLALFTTAIHFEDNIGTPTEVSGGSYAREIVDMGTPSNGLSVSTATVTFPSPTANWGTIVAVGICDASSSGNLLFFDNICPQTVNDGDPAPTFLAGSVKVSMGIA